LQIKWDYGERKFNFADKYTIFYAWANSTVVTGSLWFLRNHCNITERDRSLPHGPKRKMATVVPVVAGKYDSLKRFIVLCVMSHVSCMKQ
jgi:hypothetical protein